MRPDPRAGVAPTLFALPKPFDGHVGRIQRNAITSWTLLRPRPEIVLFGDEPGTGEICREMGLRHAPEVARNARGTPLLSDLFRRVHELSSGNVLCYVNADIVLMSDLMQSIERVSGHCPAFLLVGRRWSLPRKHQTIDFGAAGWDDTLRARVRRVGKLGHAAAFDFFVFSRGVYREIPPFLVGRTRWDKWLVWEAARSGAPVVDVTPTVTAIHQDHDYSHAGGWARLYSGPEARLNRSLDGGRSRFISIFDSTHRLTEKSLMQGLPLRAFYLPRKLEYFLALIPRLWQRFGLGLTP